MPKRKCLAKISAIFNKEGNLDFRGEMCFCIEMRRPGVSLCARSGVWHDFKASLLPRRVGGDHRQRLPLPCLSPWPGQGPLTCPDWGQQQGNESLQCQAPGLCRGPRSKNPPSGNPESLRRAAARNSARNSPSSLSYLVLRGRSPASIRGGKQRVGKGKTPP